MSMGPKVKIEVHNKKGRVIKTITRVLRAGSYIYYFVHYGFRVYRVHGDDKNQLAGEGKKRYIIVE
jgi:hypothetical protein